MSLPPPPSARLTVIGVTDLLLVVIVVLGGLRLLLPLLGGIAAPDPLSGEALRSGLLPLVLSILAQSGMTLAALYLVVIRMRGLTWQDLGLVTPPPGWLMRGVLLALVAVPLVGLVNLTVQRILDQPIDNPQIELLSPVAISLPNYLVMLVLAAGLVPLVEELAFRGLLQGWLRERFGPQAAMVVSALVFASMHGIPSLIPALLVVGGLLAWLYERSGSLWPSIAMHAAFNAIMTTLLYLALQAGAFAE